MFISTIGRLKWYCNEILRRIEGSGRKYTLISLHRFTAISVIEFNKEGTHLAYGNADGIVSVIEIGQAVCRPRFLMIMLELGSF